VRLPHGRELLEILPLGDLYTIYQEHERLHVFAQKGRVCVSCGRVGTLLVVSKELERTASRKRGSIGREHVDLYTDDFVLMTVDHIIPYSISKDDTDANKQPMCDPCNSSKGNKPITNEQLSLHRKNAKPQLAGVEILRTLVDNIHRLNGDDAWLGEKGSNLPITGQSRAPYH
jgi:hypothetical protein